MNTHEPDWIRSGALLWALSLPLAGCGDDGGGAEASETGSSTGGSTTEAPTTDMPTSETPTTETSTTEAPTTAADSSSSGQPDPSTSSSTGEPEGTSSSTTDEGSSSESSSTGEATTVMISATFTTFLAGTVAEGSFCTVDGCEDIIDSEVQIEVPAETDVDLWVEADGSLENHFQFTTTAIDEDWTFISPTTEEVELVASIFGVTIEAGTGSIAQQVFSSGPFVPAIDDPDADGPFYLTPGGAPSKTMPQPFGFYVFYNVSPGAHAISVPGCDEGDRHWGPSSDESIDLDLTADGTVLLTNLDCN